MIQVGPDVTVLARIDAKPHPSAVDEVISLLLSDTVEQKLVLSDESSSIADSTSSIDSNSDNHDGWIAKRRKHNENISSNSSTTTTTSTAASQDFYFNVAVAVKQNNILATAFHPELTNDLRWHR